MQTDAKDRTTHDPGDTPRTGVPADAADTSSIRGDAVAGAESVDSPIEAPVPPWFRARSLAEDAESAPQITAVPGGRTPKLRPGDRRTARIVVRTGDLAEPLPWQRRLVRWFRGLAAAGYGVSLLVHTVLLVLLGLWLIDVHRGGPTGAALLGFSEDDGLGFDFGLDDNVFEEAGGGAEVGETAVTVQQILPDPIEEADPVLAARKLLEKGVATDTPARGTGVGGGDGDGGGNEAGDRDRSGGGRRQGGNSITKGRFTVRITPTREPEPGESIDEFDPKPGENYFVYIHIALPDDLDSITVNDISGSIEGSDGWRTEVPYHPNKRPRFAGETTYYKKPNRFGTKSTFTPISERDVERGRKLPIIDNTVTLRLTIPAPFVEDSLGRQTPRVGIEDEIRIECKPLEESQRFQIVF